MKWTLSCCNVRWASFATGVAYLATVVALCAPPAHAAEWVPLVGMSPATTLVSNSLCYTDGTDLVCDGAAGALGDTPDRLVSGTTAVTAYNTGTINLMTGGVTTGYFNTAGILVAPGVSLTTHGVSSTHGFFSGNVGIGTATPGSYRLYVAGNAYSAGTWGTSDARYKENVTTLEGLLAKVTQLRPVSFVWKPGSFAAKDNPGEQIGVIAQEVERIFPDLVRTNHDGYKAVAYDRLSVVLLGAVNDLNAENEALKLQLRTLEHRLKALECRTTPAAC